MRELLRLALTLLVVGAVSAVSLTGVNSLTEPVILARQEAEYREALQAFFPAMARFEPHLLDRDAYDLIYDAGGGKIGVMATVRTQGYDGYITYNLAVDSQGKIVGMRIISHTETPGIGTVIEEPRFQERFTGKGVGDPIQAGVDVDIISGSTVSTMAMINSVRRTVETIGANFLGVQKEVFDISAVPDGTHTGSAKGFYPEEIVVEVTVSGGRITSIEVLKHGDTPTYFAEAYDLVPKRIMDSQSLDIDTKTGATGSAEGIRNAVLDALQKAAGEGGGEKK